MNSYNHPMYGAVGSWLYACFAGIRPLENGYQRVAIRPCFPKKLLSVQASVDTARGRLNVRWVRRKGVLHLFVDVPFGVEAEVTFGGQTRLCGSGSHAFQET